MSQPFIPIPVTDENVVFDRFGNPLNVGTHVMFGSHGEEGVGQGVICGYNHHYFDIAILRQQHRNGVLMPLAAEVNCQLKHYAIVNAESLMDPQVITDQADLYKTVLDFSPSETKKVSRKYAVYLVVDETLPQSTPFRDMSVIVTTVAGSNSADLDMLARHIKLQLGCRIVSRLCASRKGFTNGWSRTGYDNLGLTHNWDIMTQYYGGGHNVAVPSLREQSTPQAAYQLSKKRMQEIGLLEHLNTVFTVEEYNNLDIEQVSKLEILI